MISVLSPLYAATYAALLTDGEPNAALQALGVTHVGAEPYGEGLPYVRFDGDTETEDPFYSDATGTASDATLSLTVWAANDKQARAVADEIVETLTGTLSVEGFGVIRTALDLNTRIPAERGEPQGRALRFRYTASAA